MQHTLGVKKEAEDLKGKGLMTVSQGKKIEYHSKRENSIHLRE